MREPPPPLSPDLALFLDFDGTLVDLAATPDDVRVPEELATLLQCTAWGLNGALAIVSGRPIPTIDAFLDYAVPAVAGVSGAERRSAAGQVFRTRLDPAVLDPARAVLSDFAHGNRGVLLEDKGMSLAAHYRLAPTKAEACHQIVARCARESGGRLEHVVSNMVAELRPVGISKAGALLAYMNEPPFAGRRPVFVGDDLIDEDAFQEVERTNGFSVIVGDRTPTVATTRLANVGDVYAWLRAFCAFVRDEPTTGVPPRFAREAASRESVR